MNYAELPKPEFQVGEEVNFTIDSFNRRECLYYLIRKWRAVGEYGLRKGREKEIIRGIMRAIESAHRVTVAGIVPRGMHGIDTAFYNVSYIAGNPGASSPLGFKYILMFEAHKGENQIVSVPLYAWWPNKTIHKKV